MPEKLHELLIRLSGILHWIGKYESANELNDIAEFLQENDIDYADQLEPCNMPYNVELCDQIGELTDLIEKASNCDDESKGMDLITDYYEKNLKDSK